MQLEDLKLMTSLLRQLESPGVAAYAVGEPESPGVAAYAVGEPEVLLLVQLNRT
jgi:hypothetical protein